MKIFLVRHGDIRDPADFFTRLTEKGVDQIRELGQRLKDFEGTIYTSPYARCMESAHILAEATGMWFYSRPGLGEVGYFGDETLAQAQSRGVAEMIKLMRDSGDVVVVSHGGPIQGIALFLGHADGGCARGQMLSFES